MDCVGCPKTPFSDANKNSTRKSLAPEESRQRRKILKNAIAVSLSFMILFTCYNSMENLQSSINKDNGTISLAALYTGFLLSSCFLPSLLLKYLGEKYTLVLCSLSYVGYMAALFYPEIYILVPTAIVLGLGAAALWSALGTYITKAGEQYAMITEEDSNFVITRFFSIFFMFYQSSQIWGNLLSSTVLSAGVENISNKPEVLGHCGYNFCISKGGEYQTFSVNSSIQEEESSQTPERDWRMLVLITTYVIGPILAALLILVFVDPIERRNEEGDEPSKSVLYLLAATFHHLRHPYQILLVPISIWSGVERAFLGADFTAAFVSCSLGIHMVGYTMICYGICGVISSSCASTLVKIFRRIPVMMLAMAINLSLIVTFIYWTPKQSDLVWFFVMAGLWGFADCIWQTQINSIYGVLFPDNSEAAFSNCRLWEATGFTIAFACSSVLCIHSQIIVVTTNLVLGMLGYITIEVISRLGGVRKDENGQVVTIDKLIYKFFNGYSDV